MSMKKLLSLALVFVMVLGLFAGCKKDESIYQPFDPADVVEHTDHTSVYETVGSKVTIDMVEENDMGLAFATVDGVKYELGMDFLSYAMVYNCSVPEGSTKYTKQEDVFNEWWKLYIQRWNYLVPEIPLYSNQYFDLYNAKIEGLVTTPYWSPADAIIAASVKTADNSVILGSATALSGAFRNSSWGKASPGSSDLDIENLTTGYSTLMTDKNGAFVWNEYAVAKTPVAVKNDDGTLTYTIELKKDMVFSDGSKINAKNYIASILANSTVVGAAAGGTGKSGQILVGYDEFYAYDGTNADAEGVSKYFSGIKLINDYTFSVTYTADYADYYYVMSYAAFSPSPLALYLGENTIEVAEDGSVGLSDGFYAKTKKDGADVYTMADVINANLEWNSNLPYSGPYIVKNYDESSRVATLELNPKYPGDTARGKASIKTITYIEVVSKTQMDKFKNGEVDIIAGITGGAETKAALELVKSDPTKYAETHYDRAGYGKIGMRCDFGPTSMVEVRQAIMYTINRPEFAQTFTGGYGSVVHGPYYEKYPAFIAVKDDLKLNTYDYSADAAIEVLEAGGWIYNDKGEAFKAGTDAVRYKKLSGYEKTEENLTFKTIDGEYKTVKIDGEYYMPLAINWFGTQPNDVTDQLITAWQTNPVATSQIGMYITYSPTDFNTGLYAELYRMESKGYDGVPKLNAVNFATGFTSAVYDYSWNWTIDPELIAVGYSVCFVRDAADYMENYK